MHDLQLLDALHGVATAIRRELDNLVHWELAGTVKGQYTHDLVADAVAVEGLIRAGFGVMSEESGLHDEARPILVVVDPVDGSTNAAHGLPWWATSLCALDADGPRAAVVVNQATGWRYQAVRGGGASVDGASLVPSKCRRVSEAFVVLSGHPSRHLGWAQYRALGASALDLCAVAGGAADGYLDCGSNAIAPWDYLGGMLICQEAGAVVVDVDSRDLVVREMDARRRLVAASSPELLDELLAARRALDEQP